MKSIHSIDEETKSVGRRPGYVMQIIRLFILGLAINASPAWTVETNSSPGMILHVKMTFYGIPDNDPPGYSIAYPRSVDPRTLHERAGGTGTFEDPLTVAVVTRLHGGSWDPGTRLYVPALKRYLLVEDECASCSTDQIDVWLESNSRYSDDQVLDCEETWTPDEPVKVEIDPPFNRKVIAMPLTAGCFPES